MSTTAVRPTASREISVVDAGELRTPIVTGNAARALAVLRLAMGWTFLWAFLDKAFGLGFATERADAWINGGSPTFGFLSFGTTGPFAETFQGMAGTTFADVLFMVGLLGLGVALTLGIGMRVAAVSGGLLLAMMYLAQLPVVNNPFMNGYLIEITVLAVLALTYAGDTWGLGARWAKVPLVRRFGALR